MTDFSFILKASEDLLVSRTNEILETAAQYSSSMAPTIEIKESTVLVILGASGDLAKKKLVSYYKSALSAEELKPQNSIPNLKPQEFSGARDANTCSSSKQKHSRLQL